MPVKLDMSTAQPINSGGGVTMDMSTAQPIDGAPAAPSAPPQASFMSQAGSAAMDTLKGAGKSLIGHVQNAEKMIAPGGGVTGDKTLYGLPSTPNNTAQKVGAGLESAAEFAVPIGGPESAMARVGLEALRGGLVNKAQGGGFGAGAAMGGAGEGIGQGIKAIAPGLAESALNIRKTDRAYKPGGSIGRSILDETRGVSPGTVAESAQNKLNTLTPQLDAAAKASPNTMSLTPARRVIGDAQAKAVMQNEPTTAKQLSPMISHLQENAFTGRQYAPDVSPAQGLLLKRGFGNEFIHNWNPETMSGVKGTAAQTYHNLGEEFNNAVPEARGLNSRISNLIPVAKRGEAAELNAPTSQRIAGRVLAHTGALTGALGGSAAGYQHGGALGAMAGGLAGLAVPEMIGSPTGQMIAARAMNSGAVKPLIRSATGGLLQAARDKRKDEEQ